MKNKFVELPISTRDGIFLAHYSEKGLAEIDWPKVGRASSRAAKKKWCSRQNPQMASHDRNGVEKNSCREKIKTAAARLDGQNGISKIRVAADVENFHRQNEKLRRNRGGDWQSQGRPRGGRRVRGESGSGFGSVPSRAGREQKTRRLLRRIGLETQFVASAKELKFSTCKMLLRNVE